MNDNNEAADGGHIELTASIVAAYLTSNNVQAGDIPGLINNVHAAITGLGQPAKEPEPEFSKPTPAQIRKSIQPGGLISFIDGKSYKTLKRHLTKHGLDPRSYRERYGLPADYPTTAASYSEQRSALARHLGLGRKGEQAAPEPEPAESSEEPPKRRGRKKRDAGE